jgi:fatty-acyl-CoA synthase
MDSQGFIRVTGRVKDMIIRGGENHFPAEIEAVLVTHPNISQVAVVGLPDDKWGEIIAAFVLSDYVLDPIELRSHCRTHLSPQKTPSIWVHVPDFPLTGSGKVQKFAIREKYLKGKYGKVLI